MSVARDLTASTRSLAWFTVLLGSGLALLAVGLGGLGYPVGSTPALALWIAGMGVALLATVGRR
ncbi:hypothetical protein [Halomarina oriensis]|uniref:Uncharacterized protein n=1 Tax=Halomarina oriensis TaxID=671145 RepID=A0A6B0GR41_9EURY|nr:hypothetical protein [Halomarina oriensis]MWG36541.1 hypothetical protein [Halomarina oriensis]